MAVDEHLPDNNLNRIARKELQVDVSQGKSGSRNQLSVETSDIAHASCMLPDAVRHRAGFAIGRENFQAKSEKEVEKNQFRLCFLTGHPFGPTGTKASGPTPGSGTARGSSEESVYLGGESG